MGAAGNNRSSGDKIRSFDRMEAGCSGFDGHSRGGIGRREQQQQKQNEQKPKQPLRVASSDTLLGEVVILSNGCECDHARHTLTA